MAVYTVNKPNRTMTIHKPDCRVILAKRRNYILPWTAYMVPQPHQKRKLQQEYEACKKAGAAP